MKSLQKKIAVGILLVAVCVFGAAFAGCGYTPDADYWYKMDDVYRVIEFESQTPEKVENLNIWGLTVPVSSGLSYRKLEINKVKIDRGSIFFEIPALVNREGIETIYKALNLYALPLQDECKNGISTEYYTFNKITNPGLTSSFPIPEDYELPPVYQLGYSAKADKYTVNYTDYSEKGEKTGEGSFEIFVVGTIYFDVFSVS